MSSLSSCCYGVDNFAVDIRVWVCARVVSVHEERVDVNCRPVHVSRFLLVIPSTSGCLQASLFPSQVKEKAAACPNVATG